MPVYAVSQLASYLKDSLENDPFLRDVWVSGEVSNLARPGSGHSYFTLKDSSATMRCVMFRNSRGAERLENGASVIAHGRVSIYEVRGDLQLIVDIVQPEGMGELQLRLEQLKLQLENEGLFEPSRKRELPQFPRRIAVITSPTGAVWHDIQNVIRRRYPLVELALTPAPVQGDAAAPGIVEAFQAVNEMDGVDVVILARGGGSLEDMWSFNEEAVARAVYACRAPVVSAVGHETDYTIADLVADQRAPTPSAAAEMAVPNRLDLASKLLVCEQSLYFSVSSHMSAKSQAVNELSARLHRSSPDLDSHRMRIDDRLRSAGVYLRHCLDMQKGRLEGLRLRLEALSPKDTLRRGYAIVERRDDGSVVRSASQVGPGETVRVTVESGSFEAEVKTGHNSQE